MIILEAKHISKTFFTGSVAVKALRPVSLQFESGTFTAIIGRSGSGKSTLLHILGGLVSPDQGDVYLEGKSIYTLSDHANTLLRRRRIGFVFQFYNLLPELTVYENIVMPIHLDGKKEDKAYIQELISFLGLEDKIHTFPHVLSGGQQQRVALARALACKPAILLADEPTGNLDKQSGDEVIDLLARTRYHFNQTIILVTHDLQLASHAQRIITLNDGKIERDNYA